MKRVLLVAIISLLVMASAYAESFTVVGEQVKGEIFPGETAEFSLTVSNLGAESDRLTLYSTDPQWRVYFEGSIIRLGPKESKTISVLLDPSSSVQVGKVHSIPLVLRSLTDDESVSVKVSVLLASQSQKTYAPSVFIDAVVNENNQIDPTVPIDVTLRLINKNPLDINSLVVTLTSPLFNEEFSTQLAPNDQVTKILSYKINPQTPPQKAYVDIALKANNISLGSMKRVQLEVIPALPGFEREVVTEEKEWLKEVYVVKLFNNGNVEATEKVQLESSFLQRLFTQSDIEPTYQKIDGEYYSVFDVTLAPGTGLQLSVVKNYQPFAITTAILLVVVLVCVTLYYLLRSAVVIRKEVRVIEQQEEGVSKMKVLLHVKNRTGKLLENVKVIERTPNITEVDKQFAVGTLKPTKIVAHGSKGTLVRWDFATLEPYEERIITYIINSKLSILGDIGLPASIVKYDTYGQTRTVTQPGAADDEFDS
ncbi:MAG TPA: hypothetical protein VK158_02425 [Acidobacteriota bacterium]|nr:hypothetical protein [Acidobacteriota bacterium]